MIVTIGHTVVVYEPVDDPIGRLLGDVRPVGWDDPKARARRIRVLEGVACARAEAIVEVVVQRAMGRNLTPEDDTTRAMRSFVCTAG